uniref:Transmembrane protein n=1 Tax=Oryza nivara TaxID=4536 RepID=A0A0E0H4F3_ORYNI
MFRKVTSNSQLQAINMVFLSMATFMGVVWLLVHHHQWVLRLCLELVVVVDQDVRTQLLRSLLQ